MSKKYPRSPTIHIVDWPDYNRIDDEERLALCCANLNRAEQLRVPLSNSVESTCTRCLQLCLIGMEAFEIPTE